MNSVMAENITVVPPPVRYVFSNRNITNLKFMDLTRAFSMASESGRPMRMSAAIFERMSLNAFLYAPLRACSDIMRFMFDPVFDISVTSLMNSGSIFSIVLMVPTCRFVVTMVGHRPRKACRPYG